MSPALYRCRQRGYNREVTPTVISGGEGGIRTHGPVAQTAVFETARFGHSRTSPFQASIVNFTLKSILLPSVQAQPRPWPLSAVGVGKRSASVPGFPAPIRRRTLRHDDLTGVRLAD